jgi:hypothetical protein
MLNLIKRQDILAYRKVIKHRLQPNEIDKNAFILNDTTQTIEEDIQN